MLRTAQAGASLFSDCKTSPCAWLSLCGQTSHHPPQIEIERTSPQIVPRGMSARRRTLPVAQPRRRRAEQLDEEQLVLKRPAAAEEQLSLSSSAARRGRSRRPAAAQLLSEAIVPAEDRDVPSTSQQRAAHNLSRVKFCLRCGSVFADGPRHKSECASENRVVTVRELEEYVAKNAGTRHVQPGVFTSSRGTLQGNGCTCAQD